MVTRAAAACGLAVLALSATAAAQPATPATGSESSRRELITQALQASEQGNHPLALDYAMRAGRVRMSTPLRMLLAQEHNHLGHTLDAFDYATRCVREAEADPALADRTHIMEGCNALVASLRERVGRISLRVPDPVPSGLRVRVAGSEVSPTNYALPYPVLPGNIMVEATAGSSTFRQEVTLNGGETREVVLDLTESGATNATTPNPNPTPLHRDPPRRTPSGPGAGPWVVAGAGVAILGAAAVFFVLRNGAHEDALASCDANLCYDGASQDRARTWNTLTNVSLVTGAAAVAGGVLWFILARPRAESPRTASLRWSVSPTAAGLAAGLEGSF